MTVHVIDWQPISWHLYRITNGTVAFIPDENIDHADTANRLNQLTSSGSLTLAYDGRGNLTNSGAANYVYDSQNQLTSATAATTTSLLYDPLGRLREVSGGSGTPGQTRPETERSAQ